MIGKKYKYPNSIRIFVLKEIRGFIYEFECGHWCTDSVFMDLIDLETGIQNYMGIQLKLF